MRKHVAHPVDLAEQPALLLQRQQVFAMPLNTCPIASRICSRKSVTRDGSGVIQGQLPPQPGLGIFPAKIPASEHLQKYPSSLPSQFQFAPNPSGSSPSLAQSVDRDRCLPCLPRGEPIRRHEGCCFDFLKRCGESRSDIVPAFPMASLRHLSKYSE